ncbi:hypothetical protein HGRIS_004902 [Hohenbuehelia grisea]|uniref:DUF6534 domain-containing protein n=1 Tax=Hohenbuehelia grisea TaxID=104357 RepID=A0ABR3JDJ9_9AGAR
MFGGLLTSAILFGIELVQAGAFFNAYPNDPFGHKVAHVFPASVATTFPTASVLPFGTQFDWVTCGVYLFKFFPVRVQLPSSGVSFNDPQFLRANYFNMGFSCAVDLLICGLMVSALFLYASPTSSGSLGSIFLSYVLNTGMLASFFSLASLIAFAVEPTKLYFLGFRIVLATVHANCFIAMLNARYYFKASLPSRTMLLESHEVSINISKRGNIHVTPRTDRCTDMLPSLNEAGLPLFRSQSMETSSDSGHPSIVEVRVHTEETTMA